jgi:acyl carrier protein
MDKVEDKLSHCFAMVFRNLDPSRIPSANAREIPEWDSLAQVNLLSVIGEEFGMDIEFDDFEGATSFAAIAERLRHKAEGA